MKRLIITLISLISIYCFGQNIIIQNNVNGGSTTESKPCGYTINGICSSEDIGGVDAEVFFSGGFRLRLTNYNQYPVTVVWEAEYNHGDRYKTGTCVLGAYGTDNAVKVVTLHDGGLSVWSLVGTITRRFK